MDPHLTAARNYLHTCRLTASFVINPPEFSGVRICAFAAETVWRPGVFRTDIPTTGGRTVRYGWPRGGHYVSEVDNYHSSKRVGGLAEHTQSSIEKPAVASPVK